MYPSEWVKYTTPSDITPGENIGERELSVGIRGMPIAVVYSTIRLHQTYIVVAVVGDRRVNFTVGTAHTDEVVEVDDTRRVDQISVAVDEVAGVRRAR